MLRSPRHMTGKTFRGVRWIVDQVLRGADPRGIAFVSYTVSACDEARRRVLAGLAEQAGLELYECEIEYCATLHALCKRALGLSGKWNAEERLAEFCDSYGYSLQRTRRKSDSEDMEDLAASGGEDAPLLEIWNWARNRLVRDADAAYQAFAEYEPDAAMRIGYPRFLAFVSDYESWKRSAFCRDYADLLLDVLDFPRALPVSVVAIDEAQDMTPLLWAAVDVLFAEAQAICYLGDDDQAIYTFTGAAPELLNERPAARVVKLEQSYRLPARVAALAARIIGRNRNRVEKRVLPRPGAEGEIGRAAHLGDLALTNGESWFVLFRNWIFAQPLAAELEETGIPYRIQGEARYTPWSDRGPLRAARAVYRLSEPGGTVTLAELGALADKSRVESRERPGAWVYGAKSRLEAFAGERPADRVSLAALPELGLTEWGFDRVATRDLGVLAGGVSARDLSAWQAARGSGQWGRILAGEAPSVVLSTIHGVKGQQADNVAALAACTRMPARNLQDPNRCEEEARLAYVAVTRAYKRFYVLDGGSMPCGQPYEVYQ